MYFCFFCGFVFWCARVTDEFDFMLCCVFVPCVGEGVFSAFVAGRCGVFTWDGDVPGLVPGV